MVCSAKVSKGSRGVQGVNPLNPLKSSGAGDAMYWGILPNMAVPTRHILGGQRSIKHTVQIFKGMVD